MLATRIAPILTPWNPVVWLVSARLLRATELDCDRRVLRHRPDVGTYGSTLIEVSSRVRGRLVAVAAFAESQAPLRSRILNMTTPSRTVSVVALLTSLVFGAILMIAAFQIPVPSIRAELVFESGPGGPEVPAAGDVTEDQNGDGGEATEGSDSSQPRAISPDGRWTSRPGSEREELARSDDALADLRAQLRTLRERYSSDYPPIRDLERRIARIESAMEVDASRPIFTPFTAAPRLLNPDRVREALVRAYPPELRAQGIGGQVTVWFFIENDGTVGNTILNGSSGHAALDEAAMRVAEIFRFSPALNRDERVPVWVNLPITFRTQ
jgi:TonB family protein